MNKRIKIFAAFKKDVEEDAVRFGDFLCTLNCTLNEQCRNIEFSIFKDEKELCETLERSNEKIEGDLDTCEYFLLILSGNKDDYILDRLNRAIENYEKKQDNPVIRIFVNTKNKDTDNVIDYFSSAKYEHYVEKFEHYDTLIAKFLTWLSAKEKDFTYEVDIDNYGTPVIKVGGHPVSGLLDFDALLKNENYQDEKNTLLIKREEREDLKKRQSNTEDDEVYYDIGEKISKLAKEIKLLQDNISEKEKTIIKIYQDYAEKTLANEYDERIKKAIDCLESGGSLEKARRILDSEGSKLNLEYLLNEKKKREAKNETDMKIVNLEINRLFQDINLLLTNSGDINSSREIEKNFAEIEYYQREFYDNDDDASILRKLAIIQMKTNHYEEAETNYKEALKRSRKLARIDPDVYLPDVASATKQLAILQSITKRSVAAEANFNESLKIYRELARTNPDAYLSDVAATLNEIATIQSNTKRSAAAEANFNESLKIYREVAKINPDVYLSDVAAMLGKLAVLQSNKNSSAAEANFIESLAIYRKLLRSNEMYKSIVADTLNDLANIQKNTDRQKEAESSYTEALEIYRELASSNPAEYLPDVADIQNNLAVLQSETDRYADAESNYIKTQAIYRFFARTNPEAYLPHFADSLYNLAYLQMCTDRYAEAETNITEALEKYQELAKTNPDAYLLDVEDIMSKLIFLKKELHKTEEAEELQKEFDKFRRIKNDQK